MSSYTVNALENAAWLVYINGLEIPVMGFTVTYGIWAMPKLTLDLVPHYLINRVGNEDRLQVAVFYLDHHWNTWSPTFCLMGEFEVVGQSYMNTSHGRTLRLNAVSHLQIFEQLNFYYISSLKDIVTSSSPGHKDDPGSVFVAKPLFPTSLFMEGLTSPATVTTESTRGEVPVDADNFIKRPVDFVTNIFRALLRPVSTNADDVLSVPVELRGKELPRSSCSVPGKNFFARWLKMTSFHKRWAAMPILEDGGASGCFPLVKAAQDTNVLPALQNQIGAGVGYSGTAWQLLKKVLAYLFMEILTVPAPPAATTSKKTGVIGEAASGPLAEDTARTIPTFFVKPQCFFALPPTCNVVFPSMIKTVDFKEDYMPQPTRIYLGESFMTEVLNQANNASIAPLIDATMTTGYPPQVKKRMLDLAKSPESNNKNFLLFPEEYYKGPVTRRLNAPPWMYMLSQRDNAQTSAPQNRADAVLEAYINETSEARTALGSLFDKYAEYEFWRSRYAERVGSVSMAWNPYIVPGFPMAIFDERPSAIDVMAYPLTVTHSASAGPTPNMSTSVAVSFIRSMPEFIGQLGADVEEDTSTETYDISPPEPIEEIREVFQRTTEANTLYKRMLYRSGNMSKSAAFDWRNIMRVVDSDGEVVDTVGEAWKLKDDVSLQPKDGYQVLFNSRTAAMRYASRPACTLQEYIEIWHGKTIDELTDSRDISGEYHSFYSVTGDVDKSRGALFWGRIYKLQQGPGSTPPVAVSNVGSTPDHISAGDGNTVFVDKKTGMPETRKDWDTILEKYRKIVRSEYGKVFPQQ